MGILEPVLELEQKGRPRKPCLRRIVDAIRYVQRTECQWRRQPKDFPPSNVIAQAALRTRTSLITAKDLLLQEVSLHPAGESDSSPAPLPGTTIEEIFEQQAGRVFATVERLLVAKALELAHHNQVQAARLLGVSRNVLRDRIQRYGLIESDVQRKGEELEKCSCMVSAQFSVSGVYTRG